MYSSTHINPIDITHLYKELSHLFPPKIAKNNIYSCNIFFYLFFFIQEKYEY